MTIFRRYLSPRLPALTLVLLLLLAACNIAQNVPVPPAASTALDATWQTPAAGMEVRQELPNNDGLKALVTVRLDPAAYTFKAHYQPGQARTLREWQAALPGAAVIINANFFHADYSLLGLLITDEGAFGETFVNRGGMFKVEAGVPSVQMLTVQPYDGRWLDQAVQGFPGLVIDGAASGTTSTRPSRRTVIAEDRQGRIIIMATPLLGLGLAELSQYLAVSDLQLVNAVNLDGGGSTMLAIAPLSYTLLSFDAVPAVLAAYPRTP